MTRIAIYAGSFDPITLGHADVVRRTLTFADEVIVAVAINSQKTPLFTLDERVRLIRDSVGDDARIRVASLSGLLVDFAREAGARLIVRGLRAVSDFEYEFQMALMNRHLLPDLETVFMVPSVELAYVSSSIVREVARYGGSLDGLVAPAVADALRVRFAR